MKALLVVLSSRPVARDWAWKYLLLPNNRKIMSGILITEVEKKRKEKETILLIFFFVAPFDTVFVHKLFQVDTIQAGDELLLAQIMLALGTLYYYL